MKKTVIFDMDGVIFDTENLILQNWRELAAGYGCDAGELEDVFYSCIGTNAAATKEIVLAHFGEQFPYAPFRAASSVLFQQKVESFGMPVKRGARELLAYLKEAAYRIGLASSTRKAVVEQELRSAGLRDFFDVVVGGDMVHHSKPEPDVFLKCCELLGERPAEAYVIEDSYNGVRAAKRAGAVVIMVPDLIQPDEEMQSLSDYIMPSLAEAETFFREKSCS